MKALWLLLLAMPLALCGGCGGDDGGGGPPPPPTDQEVLAAGWDAFEAGDLAEADDQFRELLARGALTVEAHNGLGWRFLYGGEQDSAYVHFERIRMVETDSSALELEIHAGWVLVVDTYNTPWEVILMSEDFGEDWVFAHDATLTGADIIVLRAANYYAWGRFADSLGEVQRLAPTFDADVDTPAGRAALAAKIEELQS